MTRAVAFAAVTAFLVAGVVYVLYKMAATAGVFGSGKLTRCASCGRDFERTVFVENRGELCEACYGRWRSQQPS